MPYEDDYKAWLEKKMPCWYGCEKWKYRWGWIDGKRRVSE